MKVLNKLSIAGRALLTLDGDILGVDATKVLIDGEKYDFDIAFDMKNTIGVKADKIDADSFEFIME